jgi:hypothetical protein
MSPRGVLVVARDAGAAAALAPVVAALHDEGTLRPEIVAWGHARAAFEADGLSVREFPEDGEVASLLASADAAAVLTGTSLQVERDSPFWSAGVPSVALLDHWKNYAERFTLHAPFDALPTIVAVMDDVAERALVALGCPPGRVRVTGQPRFDELPAVVSADERSRARAALGIAPSRPVAVFASEPRGLPYDDAMGATQAETLEMFLDGIEEADPDALAIVKLHPVEGTAPALDRSTPEIRVLREGSTRDLVAGADVFFGISSIVLLDAAVMGQPTVSVQPGGPTSDFVREHARLIGTATTVDEVRQAFADGLARGPSAVSARPPRDAAARVCRVLHELIAAAGIMKA